LKTKVKRNAMESGRKAFKLLDKFNFPSSVAHGKCQRWLRTDTEQELGVLSLMELKALSIFEEIECWQSTNCGQIPGHDFPP